MKTPFETRAQVLVVVADNMDISQYAPSYAGLRSAALRDVGSMVPEELRWTKEQANDIARGIVSDLSRGESVLVCCRSGYNRSGLVTALTLVKCGLTGVAAIDLLRQRRSAYCVNNDLFRRIVIGEA